MEQRERDRSNGEGRGRISLRGGARQNQRVREQLWGGMLGVEEGDDTRRQTERERERELGYRTRRGMVYEGQGGTRHCDLSVRT